MKEKKYLKCCGEGCWGSLSVRDDLDSLGFGAHPGTFSVHRAKKFASVLCSFPNSVAGLYSIHKMYLRHLYGVKK